MTGGRPNSARKEFMYPPKGGETGKMFENTKAATIVATPQGRMTIVRKTRLPLNSLAKSPAMMNARKNWNAKAPKLTIRVFSIAFVRWKKIRP